MLSCFGQRVALSSQLQRQIFNVMVLLFLLLFFQTEGRFCTVLFGETKLSGLCVFFFKAKKKQRLVVSRCCESFFFFCCAPEDAEISAPPPTSPRNKCRDVNNLQLLTSDFFKKKKKINLRLLSLKAKRYYIAVVHILLLRFEFLEQQGSSEGFNSRSQVAETRTTFPF